MKQMETETDGVECVCVSLNRVLGKGLLIKRYWNRDLKEVE